MTAGTKTPALEDIDSPKHRELHRELVLTTGEGIDYGALVSALGDYGRVGSVVKEGPHPFVSVTCLDSSAKRLRADYEAGSGPFRGVTGVHNALQGNVSVTLKGGTPDEAYTYLSGLLGEYGIRIRMKTHKSSGTRYIVFDCSPEAENLLRDNVSKHAGNESPLSYVKSIRRMNDKARLIY